MLCTGTIHYSGLEWLISRNVIVLRMCLSSLLLNRPHVVWIPFEFLSLTKPKPCFFLLHAITKSQLLTCFFLALFILLVSLRIVEKFFRHAQRVSRGGTWYLLAIPTVKINVFCTVQIYSLFSIVDGVSCTCVVPCRRPEISPHRGTIMKVSFSFKCYK